MTAQQVRLLDSGACGAFVHGLEDEYQDVRNAAISKDTSLACFFSCYFADLLILTNLCFSSLSDSICALCLHNPEFALLALDYMVGRSLKHKLHLKI